MDIDGGTYIEQVSANDLDESIPIWLIQIEKTEVIVQELGTEVLAQIKTEIFDEDCYPIKIREIKSVFHASFKTLIGTCAIHIIRTISS